MLLLSLLDCGCGTGENSCMFASRGYKVTAFDLSPASIKIAKQNAKNLGFKVDFYEGDVTNFNLNRKFDIVFCMGVLMYPKHPEVAFDNLAKFVKPGGLLIAGVYNKYGSYLSRIKTRKKLNRLYGTNLERKINHIIKENPEIKKLPNYRELILDGIEVPRENFFTSGQIMAYFQKNNFEICLSSPPLGITDIIKMRKNSYGKRSGMNILCSQLLWLILKKDFHMVSGIKKY